MYWHLIYPTEYICFKLVAKTLSRSGYTILRALILEKLKMVSHYSSVTLLLCHCIWLLLSWYRIEWHSLWSSNSSRVFSTPGGSYACQSPFFLTRLTYSRVNCWRFVTHQVSPFVYYVLTPHYRSCLKSISWSTPFDRISIQPQSTSYGGVCRQTRCGWACTHSESLDQSLWQPHVNYSCYFHKQQTPLISS